jgi:hypothetical protein
MKAQYIKRGCSVILIFMLSLCIGIAYLWAEDNIRGRRREFKAHPVCSPIMPAEIHGMGEFNRHVVERKRELEVPGLKISELIKDLRPRTKDEEEKIPQELLNFAHSIPELVKQCVPPERINPEAPPVGMPDHPSRCKDPAEEPDEDDADDEPDETEDLHEDPEIEGEDPDEEGPIVIEVSSENKEACWAYLSTIEILRSVDHTIIAEVDKKETTTEDEGEYTLYTTTYYLKVDEELKGELPSDELVIRTSYRSWKPIDTGDGWQIRRWDPMISTGSFYLEEGSTYLMSLYEDNTGDLKVLTYPGAMTIVDDATSDKVELIKDIIELDGIEETEEKIDECINVLGDPRPKMRESAAFMLGDIGQDASRALPALTELLDDEDWSVKLYARIAISKIQGN